MKSLNPELESQLNLLSEELRLLSLEIIRFLKGDSQNVWLGMMDRKIKKRRKPRRSL